LRDFAVVSTEEIIRRAGISRGALYHHFPGKTELFRGVFQGSEARVVERLAAAAATADRPFEQLVAGSRAPIFQEAESNPELRRIGLLQSRAVLGWEGWRKAATELGIGAVEVAVRVVIEAATLVATAEDPAAARERVEPVVAQLLGGLRA
jgi:AcrR family transcriptional regulator